ncbi:hypothetical protein ILYODFUR_038566 [Ilyodon furcidens]|uniref:Uncharacterized protein n=1 Tax=Ilyodon furcidens TaxID=33524 RepID=A0ABV0TEZ7_9TELE
MVALGGGACEYFSHNIICFPSVGFSLTQSVFFYMYLIMTLFVIKKEGLLGFENFCIVYHSCLDKVLFPPTCHRKGDGGGGVSYATISNIWGLLVPSPHSLSV